MALENNEALHSHPAVEKLYTGAKKYKSPAYLKKSPDFFVEGGTDEK